MTSDSKALKGTAPAFPTRGGGARARPRSLSARRRNDAITGYLMAAPSLLGSLAFVLVPLGMLVWYSLNDWQLLSGKVEFAGLENYQRLFTDPRLASTLAATAVFSLGLVLGNNVLALTLAVMLDRRFAGRGLFRGVFFSPVVVSLVAWSVVWRFLYQDDGAINGLLSVLGFDGPNWLHESPSAMVAVIIIQIFKNVGFNMVLFLAALQGVSPELKEAARIDGAGPWRSFRSVVLPLISPTVLLVVILTISGSLQAFALISLVTQGGPRGSTTVLVYYLYQQAFESKEFGYGSAIALLLFAFILAITIVQWVTRRRWVHYE